MVKTLTRHGNSQALVIEKPIMEALGISEDTPLQITVSGQSLIITKADVGIGEKKVLKHTKKLRKKYGKMLKRLAE
ncbi:MAG: AbrB/MazE/SpoVT family DNA-binding domain-containing protein [Planctomycetota bacterium]|nr:AbrB/MazE/SpoVT family DNA-binding domain-containing protein [Planctomycetota bacterium]